VLARDLVNLSPCDLYPETFADRARSIAETCKMDCTVWDEKRLEAERNGGHAGGGARLGPPAAACHPPL